MFSPCVTFNKVNTYDWFKENLVSLDTIEGYDPTDRIQAMKTVMEHKALVTGIIYQRKDIPSYEERIPGFKDVPLAHQDLRLSEEDFQELVKEFM